MKIKISFFTVMLFLALIISRAREPFIAFFAALTHELGHITVAKVRKIGLRECEISIYGAGIVPDCTLCSYMDEIFLCLGGPFINLILGVFGAWLLNRVNSSDLEFFVMSSFSLGILNLLPIKGFDGGRILSAFLSVIFSPKFALYTLNVLSFIFIFFLWSISIYLLIKTATSISLFIFSLSLFSRLIISDR